MDFTCSKEIVLKVTADAYNNGSVDRLDIFFTVQIEDLKAWAGLNQSDVLLLVEASLERNIPAIDPSDNLCS